jgi:putative membrane protein
MKTTAMLVSSFALLLAAACGHEEPAKTASDTPPVDSPQPAPAPVPTPPMNATPVAGPTSADVPREGPTAGNAEAQPVTPMTDGQILEITHTANVGEIDQAKLALSRTTDARVRSFAQMMVRDHSQADKKGMVVAKKAGVERTSSPASQSLVTDVDGATGTLKADARADFDKDYVATQVREHQSVLDAIDKTLLTDATSPDLKAYLSEVRAAVAAHLQHAQDLQSELLK